MSVLIGILVVLMMLACLAVIPIGLPGLWLMMVIVMGLVLAGALSWNFGLIGAAVVVGAEVGEFVVLRHFGSQFGGSKRAFWGAIAGGMAGLFVGVPVPLIGPIITAFIGTFVGAGLVTLYETRSLEQSTRVGLGLLLARTVAVALKVATAVVLTAAVAAALLF